MSSQYAARIIAFLLVCTMGLMGCSEALKVKNVFDQRVEKINNPFTLHLDKEKLAQR